MINPLSQLNAIRSFVVTARVLSFSLAAEELSVTPGAVSRLVRKLEEHLGVRLVDRTAHGVVLTPQGETFYRDVAGPLAAIGAATKRLVAIRSPNRIVVACYPTFAARWLLPRWNRFFDQHPEIEVQVATSLTDVDFHRDDEVDIAIRLGSDSDFDTPAPTFFREKLLDIEIVALCRPGRFDGCKTEGERAKLLAKQVLIHSKPLPGEWPQWLAAYAHATDDPVVVEAISTIVATRGPEFDTLGLSVQAAAEGIGVAIGIHAFIRDEILAGTLTCPFAFRRQSGRQFHVVGRTGGANARAVALYRRWLMNEASQS